MRQATRIKIKIKIRIKINSTTPGGPNAFVGNEGRFWDRAPTALCTLG